MGKSGFILFSFFFFLFPDFISGQENYAIKRFTTDQGLSHNHVMEITQDHYGFLWVATWDGLSRYDGYEFRNYYHHPSDSSSLLYFNAYQVEVDSDNLVWVLGGNMGVSLYNRTKDKFINFFEVAGVTNITLDQDKKLWLLCNQKIKRWDYQSNQFKVVETNLYSLYPEAQSYMLQILVFDNCGGASLIYTNSNTGSSYLLYCDDVRKQQLNFRILGELPAVLFLPVYYNARWSFMSMVSASGNFWLVNNYGILKLDQEKSIFIKWNGEIPEAEFAGVPSEYRQKLLTQIKYFDARKCFYGQNKESEPEYVESFCLDHQETVWLSLKSQGSESTGLTRCIPVKNWFKHYFLDQNQSGVLNPIFSVVKDKNGAIWAAPQNLNCIFRQEPNGKVDRTNQLDPKLWADARHPRCMLEDSAGIWIGYFNRLLLYYDFTSREQSVKFLKKNGREDISLPDNIIHIARDGKDLILFSYTSIYRYQPKSGKVVFIRTFDDSKGLYSFLKSTNGDWWLGQARCLWHFDKDFKLIHTFPVGKAMFNIEAIVEGDNNELWLALLGGGLAHFDTITEKFKILTTADGLSNNTCYGIQKDTKGNLWISTNHGISRFNPKTQQFRTFGASDGLKIDEFNSDATFQAADGEMFFGGMGGVVSFYPDSITDDQKSEVQPLVIENFKVSGAARYFNKAIYECDTVILQKGDDNFEANFACLDFRNADKIKYRYRLSGANSEFVVTDHRLRSVNYSSLDPGEYRLEIEATNREGEWVSKKALLIMIPAFYYQTIWFRLLVVLLVGVLSIYLVYGYNRRIRLKARQQQEELRLESLRGQMNPHFIFNSLNSINYFISQNDRLSANRYIADFSRLIRTILGNTTSDFISLTKELESIQDYLKLEHLRFGDKFDYAIQVSEGLCPEEISVFPGMVQPFIENAIWHGMRGLENRKGTMKIEFSQDSPGCLRCVVEDDGVGRKHSEKCKSSLPGKTSRGIGIVLERLKIVNNLRQSKFHVSIDDVFPNQEETGTRVVIDIPIKA